MSRIDKGIEIESELVLQGLGGWWDDKGEQLIMSTGLLLRVKKMF